MAEKTEHVVPIQVYLRVLIVLMVLLVVTVAMAFVDIDSFTQAHGLGAGWNTVIAIAVATVKGFLIVLFFMHVKYATRLTWIFVAAGFVWLGIMYTLTSTDYFTRNHPPGMSPKGEKVYIQDRRGERSGGTQQLDGFSGKRR